MGEDTAARAVCGEGDLAEIVALDAVHAVVTGEAFVEERVIGIEQFGDAAVVAEDVVEGQFRLAAHGAAEVSVQFDGGIAPATEGGTHGVEFLLLFRRDLVRRDLAQFVEAFPDLFLRPILPRVPVEDAAFIDADAFDVAREQPLPDEILDELMGSAVGQQAVHLGLQVLAKLTAGGEFGELRIRHGGPEEIGQARREGMFVEIRMLACCCGGFDTLGAEEEAG